MNLQVFTSNRLIATSSLLAWPLFFAATPFKSSGFYTRLTPPRFGPDNLGTSQAFSRSSKVPPLPCSTRHPNSPSRLRGTRTLPPETAFRKVGGLQPDVHCISLAGSAAPVYLSPQEFSLAAPPFPPSRVRPWGIIPPPSRVVFSRGLPPKPEIFLCIVAFPPIF